MTRDQYESLPLIQLREIAKARGMKGMSSLKKKDLIDRMIEKDEEESRLESIAMAEKAMEERARRAAAREAEAREAAASPSAESENKRDGAQEQGSGRVQAKEGDGQPAGQRQQGQRSSRTSAGRPDGTRQKSAQGRSRGQAKNQNPGHTQGKEKSQAQQRTQRQTRGNSRSEPAQAESPDRTGSSQAGISESGSAAGQPARSHSFAEQPGFANTVAEQPARARSSAAQPAHTASAADQPAHAGSAADQQPARTETHTLDSGNEANGILEVMSDGYGFIRSDNYMPGENDIYVNPAMIRRFNLKTGDILCGNIKVKSATEKFAALLYLKTLNGIRTEDAVRRPNFEDLTPIFPNERIHLERPGGSMAMRIVDLISPIGKGQRGMIVSPPKAGKTTLLKDVAKSVTRNHPEMNLIILLIDERPEEVTDIKEAIEGPNVEVIHSTFDELPDHHRRVSEMTIERAKRLVEHRKDVIILLDSITRLARAYNLTVPPSGRTLSGGLDPAALHMPKKFFGAARNMREGGSLTILATALVETGSKMDDVIYEEFKGTGNMELVLNRKLQEKRVFPAIDIPKSGTRREDLLLRPEELEAMEIIRKGLNGMKPEDAVENVLNMFQRTKDNMEFVYTVKKTRYI